MLGKYNFIIFPVLNLNLLAVDMVNNLKEDSQCFNKGKKNHNLMLYILLGGYGHMLGTFYGSIQFLMFEVKFRQFLSTLQLFAADLFQHLFIVFFCHAGAALPLLYLRW